MNSGGPDFREQFRPTADLHAWLARGQVTGWRRLVPADVRDLVADIRDEPGSHIVCAFAGVAAGGFATVGVAFVWSWFL